MDRVGVIGHKHFIKVRVQETMAELMGTDTALLHPIQRVVDLDDMVALDVMVEASNPAQRNKYNNIIQTVSDPEGIIALESRDQLLSHLLGF